MCSDTTRRRLLIDKLNCSKAAEPDGIHSKIITECSDIFSSVFY